MVQLEYPEISRQSDHAVNETATTTTTTTKYHSHMVNRKFVSKDTPKINGNLVSELRSSVSMFF